MSNATLQTSHLEAGDSTDPYVVRLLAASRGLLFEIESSCEHL